MERRYNLALRSVCGCDACCSSASESISLLNIQQAYRRSSDRLFEMSAEAAVGVGRWGRSALKLASFRTL